MSLEIRISPGNVTPIYRQIMDQVRTAIALKKIQAGDSVPSVRSLSQQLVVNHNTVAKAYQELVREGTLESRHGKGLFVTEQRQIFTKEERIKRLDQAIEIFINEVLPLDLTKEEIWQRLDQRFLEILGKEKK